MKGSRGSNLSVDRDELHSRACEIGSLADRDLNLKDGALLRCGNHPNFSSVGGHYLRRVELTHPQAGGRSFFSCCIA